MNQALLLWAREGFVPGIKIADQDASESLEHFSQECSFAIGSIVEHRLVRVAEDPHKCLLSTQTNVSFVSMNDVALDKFHQKSVDDRLVEHGCSILQPRNHLTSAVQGEQRSEEHTSELQSRQYLA